MEVSDEKEASAEESESEEGVKEAVNEQEAVENVVVKEAEKEEATKEEANEADEENMETETQEESEEVEGDEVESEEVQRDEVEGEAEPAVDDKNEAVEEKIPDSSSKTDISRWAMFIHIVKLYFVAPETNFSTQFSPQSSRQGHLPTTEAEDKVWQRQDWGNHSWKNQDQTLSFFWGGEGGDYKDVIKEVLTMLMWCL